MSLSKPNVKPLRPFFSSGPCAKPPSWSPDKLAGALLGRSHRAPIAKQRLALAIDRTKQILNIPDDYRIGIVPGSDTGAFEMALWSMLGATGVDAMAFESFGSIWLNDIKDQLKLPNIRLRTSEYGAITDLEDVNFDHDVVFTWNGTTGGVRVPNGDWIDPNRTGLTFCDATSAVFAYDMPWDRLDVTTWSWQKVLGGEAAHGMLVLSPRAVERLESYKPAWPLPKLFRLTKGGKLNESIFKGDTINTPSMLCVEDLHHCYDWAEEIGGLEALKARTQASLAHIAEFVNQHDWLEFMCKDAATRSSTSICLMLSDKCEIAPDARAAFIKKMVKLLEDEGVAYDINGYRDAPPSLRIWGGATVDPTDIENLMPWLNWAYQTLSSNS